MCTVAGTRTPRGLVEDEGKQDMRDSSCEAAMESSQEEAGAGGDGCDEDAMDSAEEEDEANR